MPRPSADDTPSNGPPLPTTVIDRPELLGRLDDVLTRAVTMLTAPAGYGKSVLAAQWTSQRCPVPFAWLDLDGDQLDPERVLTQIVDATARLIGVPVTFEGAAIFDEHSRLKTEAIARVATALSGCPETVLVIDGIRASAPVALFVDLANALQDAHECGLHLLAVGRCTPPPELMPLQLRGSVARLDADDLRLSPDEVGALIRAHSGRPIDADVAVDLAERVEGWMVGTAVVAMSRPRRADASVDDLLDGAADGIDGYYATEVFNRLPADVRTFLLQSSCVDELSPELCGRLTERSDSGQVLWGMVTRGLPVRRQPGRDGAFRYDRLFRAYLDGRRRHEDPLGRAEGLRTAARWYVERHQPLAAAECYRKLGDWDAVIDVVLSNLTPILAGDEFSELGRLVAAAPSEMFRQHAPLAVTGAWVLMADGRVAAANDLLSVFRPLLSGRDVTAADLVQATAAPWVEDMAGPLAFAESALSGIDAAGRDGLYDTHVYDPVYVYNTSNADVYRGLARASALGAGTFAGWWERVRPHLVDMPPEVAVIAPQFQVVRMRGTRALFMVLSGEVAGGLIEADLALTVAREGGLEDHRAAAEAYLALGEGLRLSGVFADAGDPLTRALELARVNDRRNLVAAATASRVHLLVDGARPREALDVLAAYRAETRHRAPAHLSALLAAGEARAVAALGDYFTALSLVEPWRQVAPAASVEVSVALAVGEVARARDVARDWRLDGSLAGSVRRALARALVQDLGGITRDAVPPLLSALRLVAEHQLIQPVIECGAPMGRLLRRVDSGNDNDAVVRVARRAEALIVRKGSAAPLFTAREAAVLARLEQGLSQPAIAQELFLSVNTVKTYVKAIYRKLGATSRSEALAAWRETLPTRHPRQ